MNSRRGGPGGASRRVGRGACRSPRPSASPRGGAFVSSTTLIVGTAGHIDHGKSSLVLALTGTDPDRLKEEKERGITTDIGFAHLTEPAGPTLSFIDVPGHELFVRNMLAGAHGVDAVLLAVAADEGVKPQTVEHVAICGLLGVRRGLVALTKCDLVEADVLEVVRAEVGAFIAGTFLEGCPIVPVSVRTRAGIDELRQRLDDLAAAPHARASDGFLRLPVDRVFTLRGFGTIVTGTLIGGRLRAGDAVEVLPNHHRSRVRGLQIHGQRVELAEAGTRVAVNLADLSVGNLSRGDVLAAEQTFRPASMLDVEVTWLSSAPSVKDGTRLRVHAASAEVLGRVRFLDRESGEPGTQAAAQLRLESPIVAVRGDRLVLRRYSPVATIGGAVVLDPRPPKRRAADAARLAALARIPLDDVRGFARVALDEADDRGVAAADLAARLGMTVPVLAAVLAGERTLVNQDGRWITTAVAARLEATGQVRRSARAMRVSELDSRRGEALETAARRAGLAGVAEEELAPLLEIDQQAARTLVRLLVDRGVLRRVGPGTLVLAEHLEALKAAVRARLPAGAKLDVGEVKALTGLSRKYAIPLLEFLDRERVTRRVGKERFVV